ncbi:response regulator [Desulfobulbus sp. US1]|nr:response regulator [Desulfobulbus sp. US4]MCW5204461.1 response regulator [Desulfobulbus sp. N2]MCW5207572.1 response regulator [Desulfobulbus sp. US2]MCW5209587.1 response regulator [Desulfobulbus sp. US1]MCW5214631.1 response regulator [Desulfobulbus sp. US5]
MTKLKLLYVDDERVNLTNFTIAFRAKYQIYTASSGREALEIFKDNDGIAIVITDQRMPGMTGVELLQHIKKQNKDVIRIVLTAYTEVADIIDAINKGHIYQYIVKPWVENDLLQVLDKASENFLLVLENKRLSTRLIDAQENERKRIAMELHDGIGQNLIALKLQFNNFCFQLESNDREETQEAATIISSTLQQTLESTRSICQNLWPVVIEKFGFDLALKEFLDNFSRDYGIEIVLGSIHVQKYFSKYDQHQIYRILQEILNNIGKHSGTKKVNFNTVNRADSLCIEITDFGCGFDMPNLAGGRQEKGCLGLNTIRERVTILGGTIDIQSFIEKGTRFTLLLPHSREKQETLR